MKMKIAKKRKMKIVISIVMLFLLSIWIKKKKKERIKKLFNLDKFKLVFNKNSKMEENLEGLDDHENEFIECIGKNKIRNMVDKIKNVKIKNILSDIYLE